MGNRSGDKNMSQSQAILDYLQSGHVLTPLEALQKFGCFRLAARVHDLRAAGHNIVGHTVDTGSGKKVAQYHLQSTT